MILTKKEVFFSKDTNYFTLPVLHENISNISFKDFKQDTISIMISNLERVGIIRIDNMQFIEPEKEIYSYVTNSDLYIKIMAECEQMRTNTKLTYPKSSVKPYMFYLTEFGKSFITTVII